MNERKKEIKTTLISAKVKMDLEPSGLVANVKKSQWHPSQGVHLGFLADLKNDIFTVPIVRPSLKSKVKF